MVAWLVRPYSVRLRNWRILAEMAWLRLQREK